MAFIELLKDESFHRWKDFGPKEIQYLRYAENDPSIVASGHKVQDVYFAFASARASFLHSNSGNFGDISGADDVSRLFARTHFLNNAILEYAICLDLSWQVVWAFIQPASLKYLINQDYTLMEKECTRDSILEQLKCIISQNGVGVVKAQRLLDIVTKFDKLENTIKLRSLYNKLKHQGTIHYQGLGLNDYEMMFEVDGKCPPMLHRPSYKPEEIESLLFNYHDSFKQYMESLITEIFPADYTSNKINGAEALASMFTIRYAMD